MCWYVMISEFLVVITVSAASNNFTAA